MLPPYATTFFTVLAFVSVVAAALAAEFDETAPITGDCTIYVRVGGDVLPAARILASDLTAGAAVGFAPKGGRVELSVSREGGMVLPAQPSPAVTGAADRESGIVIRDEAPKAP